MTDASVLENELDELEVYGNTEAASGDDKITQYNFQVCYKIVMYFKTPYMNCRWSGYRNNIVYNVYNKITVGHC